MGREKKAMSGEAMEVKKASRDVTLSTRCGLCSPHDDTNRPTLTGRPCLLTVF